VNTRRAVNDLAQYRRRKGITQETIARRMGVCKQAVTRLENEQARTPSVDTLTAYARALHVRLTIEDET